MNSTKMHAMSSLDALLTVMVQLGLISDNTNDGIKRYHIDALVRKYR